MIAVSIANHTIASARRWCQDFSSRLVPNLLQLGVLVKPWRSKSKKQAG